MGGYFSRPPPPPPPPPPRPTIKATCLHYRVQEYSTVNLRCDVCNASSSVWTFRKEGGPGSQVKITETGKHSISPHELEIPEVTEEDQGTYRCKVTNGHDGDWARSRLITLEVYSNMENFKWGDVSETHALKQRIRDAPFTRESAGIVMYGYRGAGKSSFINSVKTALTGRLSTPAQQGLSYDTTTKKISYIKIQDLPVIMCDIPGFARNYDSSYDFVIRDIILNRVADGTEYDDWKRHHDRGIQRLGSEGEMERSKWLVVYVHNWKDTNILPDGVYEHIREEEIRIRELGAQLIIVLTKIDRLERRELSRIYRGDRLRQVMKELHKKTGVDVMNIYPVQNYSRERGNVVNMDILLLNAVSRFMDRLADIN